MRKSLFCKTIAIILSVLLLISTVLFAGVTVFVAAAGGYTGGFAELKNDVMESILCEYAYEVADAYRRGENISRKYAENNFYYKFSDGTSNYDLETRVRTVTVTYGGYNITLYEKASKDSNDLISLADFAFSTSYEMRYAAPIISVASLLLFILLLVFLYSAAGHRKGTDTPMLNRVDKIPFDLYTAVCAAVCVCIFVCGALLSEMIIYNYYHSMEKTLIVCSAAGSGIVALGILAYLVCLGYTMSFATRVKVGGLIRRTLIFKLVACIFKIIKKIFCGIGKLFTAIPLVWKTALIFLAVSVLEFILLICNLWEGDNILLLWFAEKLILFPLIIAVAMLLRKLQKGGEAIAAGNIGEKIDTKYMPLEFGKFGGTLNNIGDGLGRAVEERMKSERMKTELITNVSHDIKTPLTSIVNYVDLIKKEELESENLRVYVDVLDRQSARLKKLIEDLVEASKASTGNITVNMERCEVGVLLEQSLGEYEERLSEKHLTPIISQPDEPIHIMADGRRLWRVFDNLLNNICKYALPDTRVYISTEKVGGKAVITFRNISREPLNISTDELMERFVRGDESRNTEGSGLGLSIARSLTELQNGNLTLAIDGDLFKAILTFETVE